jgi:diguanylate cyclase
MGLSLDMVLAMSHGLGLMAFVAIAYGQIERTRTRELIRQLLHGGLFGLGAIIAMNAPAELFSGGFVDARHIFIGFAGAFAGWPAALIAGSAAGLMRVQMGGAGMWTGLISISIAMGAGLAWARLFSNMPRQLVRLLLLGLMITLTVFSVFALPNERSLAVFFTLLPLFGIANLAAALVLGAFIERERHMIAKERHLTEEVRIDGLTGLLNRRAFEGEFQAAMARKTSGVALLVLDIDHFKRINDRFGHGFGDEALVSTAKLLRQAVRPGDPVGRLGGEEFAILLVGVDSDYAQHIAQRVRRQVEATTLRFAETPVSLTLSIGLAHTAAPLPFEHLYRFADLALYAAKHGGRNRVEIAPPLPRSAAA